MSLADQRARVGIQPSRVYPEKWSLAGGLNTEQTTPTPANPGELREVLNYEPDLAGGYRSKAGYERFDGRTAPSSIRVQIVRYTSLLATPTQGDVIEDGTTGARARVISTDTVNSWFVVVETTSGLDFVAGNDIDNITTAVQAATAAGPFEIPADYNTLLESAWSYYAGLIGKVGGASCSGPVRGVWIYDGKVYAFRDNSGGTAGTMWVATTGGWSSVALGVILYYYNGTKEISEGETLTGGTSGATMVARRVALTAGSWEAGDARGYVVGTAITGAFVSPEPIEVSAVTVAETPSTGTLSQAVTLPPGGTYRFRNYNFSGFSDRFRMYGVNGEGWAFEYDGTYFAPIQTGIGKTPSTWSAGVGSDKPTHLGVHKNHLFLIFRGGSVQHSGFQQPFSWRVQTGADERNLGEDCTGMLEELGDVAVICSRNRTYLLYGDVRENFQLNLYSSTTGAVDNTLQRMGTAVYLDDRGITMLQAAAEFGNFVSNTITAKIQRRLFRDLAQKNIAWSAINRERSLYRLGFTDGTAICVGIVGSQFIGLTYLDYGKTISCMVTGEMPGGFMRESSAAVGERAFFGDSEGYVFEDESGTSFDLGNIETLAKTLFYSGQMIDKTKQYKEVYIDIDCETDGEISIGALYDDGADYRNSNAAETVRLPGNRAYWDVSDWDLFFWDSQVLGRARRGLSGMGVNISLEVSTSMKHCLPHSLRAIETHQSPRERRKQR